MCVCAPASSVSLGLVPWLQVAPSYSTDGLRAFAEMSVTVSSHSFLHRPWMLRLNAVGSPRPPSTGQPCLAHCPRQAITSYRLAPCVCVWADALPWEPETRCLLCLCMSHACCSLNCPLGPCGHHAHACGQGPRQHKHDRLRNALQHLLRDAGWHVTAEQIVTTTIGPHRADFDAIATVGGSDALDVHGAPHLC